MSIDELALIPLTQLSSEYLIQKLEQKLPKALITWLKPYKVKVTQSNKTTHPHKTTLHYSDGKTAIKVYPTNKNIAIRAGGTVKVVKSHQPKILQEIVNTNIQKALDKKSQLIKRAGEGFVKQDESNNYLLTLESPASDDYIRVGNPDNILELKTISFYKYGLNKKRQKVILADPELRYYLAAQCHTYGDQLHDIRFVIDMQSHSMTLAWSSNFDLRDGKLHGKPIDTIDINKLDPLDEEEIGMWSIRHRYLALSNEIPMTEQEVLTAENGITAMLLKPIY